MTSKQIAAVVLLALGAGIGLAGIAARMTAPPEALQVAPAHPRKTKPYIAARTQISPSEEVRILVVPSSLGELFDVKCVIYRDSESHQALMSCPNASAQDLDSLPRDSVSGRSPGSD